MTVFQLAAMDGRGKCDLFSVISPEGGPEGEKAVRKHLLSQILHQPAVILAVIHAVTK